MRRSVWAGVCVCVRVCPESRPHEHLTPTPKADSLSRLLPRPPSAPPTTPHVQVPGPYLGHPCPLVLPLPWPGSPGARPQVTRDRPPLPSACGLLVGLPASRLEPAQPILTHGSMGSVHVQAPVPAVLGIWRCGLTSQRRATPCSESLAPSTAAPLPPPSPALSCRKRTSPGLCREGLWSARPSLSTWLTLTPPHLPTHTPTPRFPSCCSLSIAFATIQHLHLLLTYLPLSGFPTSMSAPGRRGLALASGSVHTPTKPTKPTHPQNPQNQNYAACWVRSGLKPGCSFHLWLGHVWEAADRCFSFINSSLSLPSSSSNKAE